VTTRVQTISDIARLAGVSKSTVSRALNDSELVGAETKERIRAIAQEHEFQLNVPAQRLSRRQSRVVGLPMFDWGKGPAAMDLFMLEIMGGISSGLHEQGYDLLVLQVPIDDVGWARRTVESGRADGFVILSASCSPEQLDALVEADAPFVIWGAASPDHAYCSVTGDSLTGGRLATEHLLAAGRRRIALVGGPEWSWEIRDRRRGYEAALADAGLELDPALVAHTQWSEPERTAAAAVLELLGHEPELDGVVANSDFFALGAIEALRSLGRRVPEDVGVVGYDDVSVAAFANPPLTTIRQDGPLAGRLLARGLVLYLQTGAVSSSTIPAQLVVRGSA
jgi:DNA-binding LacI/PurR family transcriptional regulator